MTGRLTGSIDGLPVEITAEESEGICLRLSSVRSVFPLLRCRRQVLGLLPTVRAVGLPLRVAVGGLATGRLSPDPDWVAKWLAG